MLYGSFRKVILAMKSYCLNDSMQLNQLIFQLTLHNGG
jgi:hypothetical protein